MNDSAQKIQYLKLGIAAILFTLTSACQSPKPPPPPPQAAAPAVIAESKPAPPVSPARSILEKPETPIVRSAAGPTLTPVAWRELPGWLQDNHTEALTALIISCRVVAKQPAWREACEVAAGAKSRDARRFFEQYFTPHRVTNTDGTLEGLATGYFEPTIRGSRTRSARNPFPVYGTPDDIVSLDFGSLAPALKSSALRGRIDGKRVVPYYARAQIDHENSPLRGKEIAWVEDAIDLFFLQVQGSGRIALDEGGVMRIGFAEHNGQPYRSIGRVLIERGELTAERASMQSIKAWARAYPSKLSELLNQNPRYVFFRELTGTLSPLAGAGSGPPGAMGLPLTPERSIAVDPFHIPLGAPVHIATTWPNTQKPLQRLMVAQDTGSAIRGAVRADFFWGAGDKAAIEAGRMQQSMRMWVLLPNGYPVPDAKP